MTLDLGRDIISGALFVGSAFFFIAGSVGLMRFPDVYSRLHALTKADNLGVGLLVAGLAVRADSWAWRSSTLRSWSATRRGRVASRFHSLEQPRHSVW